MGVIGLEDLRITLIVAQLLKQKCRRRMMVFITCLEHEGEEESLAVVQLLRNKMEMQSSNAIYPSNRSMLEMGLNVNII